MKIKFCLTNLVVDIRSDYFELAKIPNIPIEHLTQKELKALVRMAFYEEKDPAGELYNCPDDKIGIIYSGP